MGSRQGARRPFFYCAYGAACSEVAIDTLTGEMRVLRSDLLHDVGASINPAIDVGQVEDVCIQGMGSLTTEELVYDAKGRLTTHAPATYKIPVASDTPRSSTSGLHAANPTPSIYRSKAVGEPPLMLAHFGLFGDPRRRARSTNPKGGPKLEAPCTTESILNAIQSTTERPGKAAAMLAFRPSSMRSKPRLRGAGDARARPGLEPREAGARMVVRPSGGFMKHWRRRAGVGGARGGAGDAATTDGAGDAALAGAGSGAGAMLRRTSRWRNRDFRRSRPEQLTRMAIAETRGPATAQGRVEATTRSTMLERASEGRG